MSIRRRTRSLTGGSVPLFLCALGVLWGKGSNQPSAISCGKVRSAKREVRNRGKAFSVQLGESTKSEEQRIRNKIFVVKVVSSLSHGSVDKIV